MFSFLLDVAIALGLDLEALLDVDLDVASLDDGGGGGSDGAGEDFLAIFLEEVDIFADFSAGLVVDEPGSALIDCCCCCCVGIT